MLDRLIVIVNFCSLFFFLHYKNNSRRGCALCMISSKIYWVLSPYLCLCFLFPFVVGSNKEKNKRLIANILLSRSSFKKFKILHSSESRKHTEWSMHKINYHNIVLLDDFAAVRRKRTASLLQRIRGSPNNLFNVITYRSDSLLINCLR